MDEQKVEDLDYLLLKIVTEICPWVVHFNYHISDVNIKGKTKRVHILQTELSSLKKVLVSKQQVAISTRLLKLVWFGLNFISNESNLRN